jgi:hypothetical protein
VIELLLQAERALNMGLVDQAEYLYRQAAAADPRNSIAVVGLGRVALERDDDGEAYRQAKRALAIDPENAAASRMVERLEDVWRRSGRDVPDQGAVTLSAAAAPVASAAAGSSELAPAEEQRSELSPPTPEPEQPAIATIPADPLAAAQPEPEPEREAELESPTDSALEPAAEPEPAAERESERESEPEPEPEPELEPEAAMAPKPVPDPEPEPEWAPEPAPEPEAGAEPPPAAASETEPQPEPAPELAEPAPPLDEAAVAAARAWDAVVADAAGPADVPASPYGWPRVDLPATVEPTAPIPTWVRPATGFAFTPSPAPAAPAPVPAPAPAPPPTNQPRPPEFDSAAAPAAGAPVDADRAAAGAPAVEAVQEITERERDDTAQPADEGEPAPDSTQPREGPPTEQEGQHMTTLQALDRVKHLFGRKRE